MPFYKLSKDALLETFDDGGLVLVLPERRLVELNPSAVEIIKLLDGQRSPEQVAVEIAKNHDISDDYPVKHIIQDVLELCMELNSTGVLELQTNFQESVE
jgi:thiamine monophosphate synthase